MDSRHCARDGELAERTRKIGSGLLRGLADRRHVPLEPPLTLLSTILVGVRCSSSAIPAVLTLPLWFMFPSTRPPHAHGQGEDLPLRELGSPGVPRMLVLGSIVMALGFIVYYGLQSQYAAMLIGELHLSGKAVTRT